MVPCTMASLIRDARFQDLDHPNSMLSTTDRRVCHDFVRTIVGCYSLGPPNPALMQSSARQFTPA